MEHVSDSITARIRHKPIINDLCVGRELVMEIVTSLPTPSSDVNSGTKKHVEEWSRLDHLTGMLETARVEADHWANNTSNSRHHYGKVVDSRARNLADGSVQQQHQTKQLEVFQAHIPGRSVQVIRSHTSTTSSWHNSKILQSKSHTDWSSSFGDKLRRNVMESPCLDSLKFQHNLVNLESEKTKASFARLLPARRPPTRSKQLVKVSKEDEFFSDVPKLCQETDKNETEKHLNAIAEELNASLNETLKLQQQSMVNGHAHADENVGGGAHLKLEKKKSISDENVNVVQEEENSSPWKRDSKARWSLQYPRSKFKSADDPLAAENKSELEKALEKAIKRNNEVIDRSTKPADNCAIKAPPPTWKRSSFVTEETLKATKQKLRHLSADECKIEIVRDCDNNEEEEEEDDDGICTESKGNSDKEEESSSPSVFVKEKEAIGTGTGSLECRGKNKSEDWFDRRKSYGFEPVYGQRNGGLVNTSTTPKTNLSTDSGICRSSELELASTSIMKKLTEANEERLRKYNEGGVSQLLSQFEKRSEPRTTVVTLNGEEKSRPNEGAICAGKVAGLIRTFAGKSERADPANEEVISKRHSIACDDVKYISKQATRESLPQSDNAVVVSNVNTNSSYESGDAAGNTMPNVLAVDVADVKKPKRVEFSKTEVHFAAAEPGKIKIVETNEKPPPANLHRRKRRSLSTSPKIGGSLPQTKFGDKPADEERPSVAEGGSKTKNDPYSHQFASSVTDNGLAVHISSSTAKPTDSNRASWSLLDSGNENKSGYSTKVNFGGEGVTVVADAKSYRFEATPKVNQISDLDVDAKNGKNSENFREKLIVRIGSGGCGGASDKCVKNRFTDGFRNSLVGYRSSSPSKNSSSTPLPSTTFKPCRWHGCCGENDKLKSTSLIIDTLKKRSSDAKSLRERTYEVEQMEKKISDLRKKSTTAAVGPYTLEQPSTYLTEMNKLQQKYRISQNRSVDKLPPKSELPKPARIYNTVPGAKNGLARTTNGRPLPASVTSAFSTLRPSAEQTAADESLLLHKRSALDGGQANCDILKETIVTRHRSSKFEKYSSQSWFLEQIATTREKDGNLSDDSLKADEEVRSYMSTSIMEEYENELSGSWSRRRYFKHVDPIKGATKEDEISEKSHFKPLQSEEEITPKTNLTKVDIKRPKITSVTVNLTPQAAVWPSAEVNESRKKCTTVLLNSKNHVIPNTTTTTTTNERHRKDTTTSKENNITTASRTLPKLEQDGKVEYKPVKVVHHGDSAELPQKTTTKNISSRSRENSSPKTRLHKTVSDSSTAAINGTNAVRRKHHVYDKKLWDSGRDSWLNLPKERPVERKAYADYAKIRPVQKASSSSSSQQQQQQQQQPVVINERTPNRKSTSSEGAWNGFTDTSSDDDAYKRSYRGKQFTQPMTTISEKSSLQVNGKVTERDGPHRKCGPHKVPVTRTTSNSSLESHSNSFEYRTPLLKTEERSRRRVTRLTQRNRDAKSSSEDITSENEVGCLRSSKVKSPRKARIPKSRSEQLALLEKPNVNRLIQQKSAKMQINIFDIKQRPERVVSSKVTNRTCPSREEQTLFTRGHVVAPVEKNRRQLEDHKGMEARSQRKCRGTQQAVTSKTKEARKLSDTNKVARVAT